MINKSVCHHDLLGQENNGAHLCYCVFQEVLGCLVFMLLEMQAWWSIYRPPSQSAGGSTLVQGPPEQGVMQPAIP